MYLSPGRLYLRKVVCSEAPCRVGRDDYISVMVRALRRLKGKIEDKQRESTLYCHSI